MKNMIIFLGFILYATFIFFVESNKILGMILLINLFIMAINQIKPIDVIKNIARVVPFILLTVLINCILANYQYAFMVLARFFTVVFLA